jgi:hypothetical protein
MLRRSKIINAILFILIYGFILCCFKPQALGQNDLFYKVVAFKGKILKNGKELINFGALITASDKFDFLTPDSYLSAFNSHKGKITVNKKGTSYQGGSSSGMTRRVFRATATPKIFLSGKITNARGEILENALIVKKELAADEEEYRETDEEGVYAVSLMENKKYAIYALAPGYAPDTLELDLSISNKPAENVEHYFKLKPTKYWLVFSLPSLKQEEVKSAQFFYKTGGGVSGKVTPNAENNFEIFLDAAESEVEINITQKGYKDYAKKLLLSPKEKNIYLQLELTP